MPSYFLIEMMKKWVKKYPMFGTVIDNFVQFWAEKYLGLML
jgi:hypothetical protein